MSIHSTIQKTELLEEGEVITSKAVVGAADSGRDVALNTKYYAVADYLSNDTDEVRLYDHDSNLLGVIPRPVDTYNYAVSISMNETHIAVGTDYDNKAFLYSIADLLLDFNALPLVITEDPGLGGFADTFGKTVLLTANKLYICDLYNTKSTTGYGAVHVYSPLGIYETTIYSDDLVGLEPGGIGFSMSEYNGNLLLGCEYNAYSPIVLLDSSYNVLTSIPNPTGSQRNFGNKVHLTSDKIIINDHANGAERGSLGIAHVYDYSGNHVIDLIGSATGENFSRSMAHNGDDLFIGAPTEIGEVHRFSLSNLTRNPLETFVHTFSSESSALFGRSLAAIDFAGSYFVSGGHNTNTTYFYKPEAALVSHIDTLGKVTMSPDYEPIKDGNLTTKGYSDTKTGILTSRLDAKPDEKYLATITSPVGALEFGYDVAITSTKIIVSDYQDATAGSTAGAIYTYDLDMTNEQKIIASDAFSNDYFGYAVDATNSKIVVGAPNNDDPNVSGSAYIYDITGLNEIILKASDAADSDYFGKAVAVNSTKAIVGSNRADEGAIDAGAVYVYDLDGTNEIKIVPSTPVNYENFGSAVGCNDTKILVGNWESDVNGADSGSVHVYDLDGTNEIIITPSDGKAGDYFGISVDANDTKIIVGANGANKVYVYDLDGTNEQIIQKTDTSGVLTNYGYRVAISQYDILVGDYLASVSAVRDGAVYLYNIDGTDERILSANNSENYQYYGLGIDTNGTRIIVGAPSGSSPIAKSYMYTFPLHSMYNTKDVNYNEDQLDTYLDSETTRIDGEFARVDNDIDNVIVPSERVTHKAPITTNLKDELSYWDNYNTKSVYYQDNILSSTNYGTKIDANETITAIAAGDSATSGSVYIKYNDTSPDVKLTGSVVGDTFGSAVTITTDKIFIGARGYQNTVNIPDAGRVYAYDYAGAPLFSFKSVGEGYEANFGSSLGSNSTYLYVGETSYGTYDKGRVIVYDHAGVYVASVYPSDSFNYMHWGNVIAANETNFVVGCLTDAVNGTNSGSIDIYNLDGSAVTKIHASDALAGEYFGKAVELTTDYIYVGSNNGVYRYDLDGTNELKIVSSDMIANDYFGTAIKVYNDILMIGAPLRDDFGSSSGAVYFYDLDGNNEFKLVPDDLLTSDNFGNLIEANSGEVLVVASYKDGPVIGEGALYSIDYPKPTSIHQDIAIEASKVYTDSLIVNSPVTKTVGVGKDFVLLHDALRWVETITTTGAGVVTLSLDDGTHLAGDGAGTINDYFWATYVIQNATVTIQSASGIKANCIITLDPFDDGGNGPAIISLHNANLELDDLIIDATIGGYPYDQYASAIDCSNSHLNLNTVTLKNCWSGVGLYNMSNLYSNTYDGELRFEDNTVGITCSTSKSHIFQQSAGTIVFENNTTGIQAWNLATVKIGGVISFITNTADTDIPLNEIQYDGSYITNGAGALSFKA